MSGFPSAEKLARLTMISRQLNGTGAQPPISNAIEEKDGYIYGLVPNDEAGAIGAYLHSGVRVGWAPFPDQAGLVLSVWGGLQPEAGFEEEGVAIFMTPDGLRRLAADLRAIADRCGS